ncbi:heterokaryon incompatibility protein-domain-containing protein [Paraphoma chrysanthemicola]|nr:heterokaryon incompatibility protein-domain-containing protein [Paraphoma chrysanthemicola]
MELAPNELELIINQHKCIHCVGWLFNSLEELQRGADDGCPFFDIGLSVVDRAVSDEGFLGHTRNEIRGVLLIIYKSELRFTISITKRDVSPVSYHVTAGADSVLEHQNFGLSKLPVSTGSKVPFNIINAWIEECAQNHECCKHPMFEPQQNALHNVRFLEVEDQRILLRADIVPERYACLSHCWGTGQEIYKTTDDNITAHSTSGVLTKLLPRTFQDAVEICQRLTIRYLWIDSLCIIQNNNQDWNEQATRMADVYENAYITIAASQSKDPTEGCFVDNGLSYIGGPLPGRYHIYVRKVPNLTMDPQDDSLWPLLTRAWAFQELSLSPRTIHFGPEGIVWHCRCRWEDQRTPMTNVSPPPKFPPTSYSSLWVPKLAKEESMDLRDSWHTIVSGYSSKKLTFRKDRLPAIAAMASRMRQMRSSDRYLAGLWESSLVHDLLWFTVGDYHLRTPDHVIRERTAALEETERLPTWSWASAYEGVSWMVADSEILEGVRILEIKYATRSADILGQVKEGKIVIEAPICDLDSLAKLPNIREWFDFTSSKAGEVTLTCTELAVHDFRWDNCGSCDEMPTISDIHVMFTTAPETNTTPSRAPAQALLLKETACKGHWARIGVCTASLADFFYYFRCYEKPGNKPGQISRRTNPVYQECGVSLMAKLEAIPRQTITLV